MNKEFIPYEQALDVKELEFDEPCFGHYLKKKFYLKTYDKQGEGITLRPTFSQSFRFFREKYDLIVIIDITYINGRKWRYRIETPPRNFYGFESLKDGFDTHEEAELACLKKLIEIVKGG